MGGRSLYRRDKSKWSKNVNDAARAAHGSLWFIAMRVVRCAALHSESIASHPGGDEKKMPV
jgi:putative component of membrane protein insertase Oxa1/YidC/SpoIIIJ protein YidD